MSVADIAANQDFIINDNLPNQHAVSIAENEGTLKAKFTRFLLNLPLTKALIGLFQNLLISVLATGPLPKHLSFIMDGNRRYAKSNNLPLKGGHEAGADTLVNVISTCSKLGICAISVFAFSIENFNRPKHEVDTLLQMLVDKLNEFDEKTNKEEMTNSEGCAIRIVGDRNLLDVDVNKRLDEVERKTSRFTKRTLFISFPYTSRFDIQNAIQCSVEDFEMGKVSRGQITEKYLTDKMQYGPYSNSTELLIRTSGHTRLSDYMLWQCHNSDSTIVFSNTLWPDFGFFEFYWILIQWSFEHMVQTLLPVEHVSKRPTPSMLYGFHGLKYQFRKHYTKFEDLPAAPMAVSVSESK